MENPDDIHQILYQKLQRLIVETRRAESREEKLGKNWLRLNLLYTELEKARAAVKKNVWFND